jgi:hypothetical protein
VTAAIAPDCASASKPAHQGLAAGHQSCRLGDVHLRRLHRCLSSSELFMWLHAYRCRCWARQAQLGAMCQWRTARSLQPEHHWHWRAMLVCKLSPTAAHLTLTLLGPTCSLGRLAALDARYLYGVAMPPPSIPPSIPNCSVFSSGQWLRIRAVSLSWAVPWLRHDMPVSYLIERC